MKKKMILFIFCCTFLFNPNIVLAHPGRTDKNGCHKCYTNCAKWGLKDGEYHCHNGNTYTNSKGQTFNSNGDLISEGPSSNANTSGNTNTNKPTLKPNPKSSDNTLKLVTIDGENIEISDKMFYKTKKRRNRNFS